MSITYNVTALCDRCGYREERPEDSWRDMEYSDRKFEGWGRVNDPASYKNCELCPSCVASFQDWLSDAAR